MVEFFYTSTYTEPVYDAIDDDKASHLPQFDIIVYHLADKYLLDATLGVEARRKFSKYMGAEKDMSALTTAIVNAFEAGPEEGDHLTAIATSAAKLHHTILLGNGKENFRRATRKFPMLAAELAEHVAEKNSKLEEKIKLMEGRIKKKTVGVDIKCSSPGCAARGPITFTLHNTNNGLVYCIYCGQGKDARQWVANNRVTGA